MSTLDLTGDAHKQRLLTSFGTRTFEDRFAASFNYLYQGLAVVCQETSPGTWNVTPYPGISVTTGGGDYATVNDDINAADYVFYGGDEWEIADANLLAALDAAGYVIPTQGFDSGFTGGFG